MTNDVYAPMDINNIMNYYSNDGDGSFNPNKTDNEGFEFPIGSTSGTCIFEDGLVWTTFKHIAGDSALYCGGSTYNHGLQAGGISQAGTATTPPVAFGSADSAGNPAYKIYRVRPDIKPTTSAATQTAETALLQTSEVPYFNRVGVTQVGVTAGGLFANYTSDWTNWPAAEGAPWYQIFHLATGDSAGPLMYNDATHHFDPTAVNTNPEDVPGFPGADQTMWMIMNDLDTSRTQALYGSNPIGLEVQRTIWAYNRPGALGNTIFISYKLINKSGDTLSDMYVSQWCDPDLGFAGDDATGCDTTRSLGFVYNGEAVDANFATLGLPPPSAGFDFFQGPKVPGAPTDTAIFDMQKFGGYKNLPMTAFDFFINGNAQFTDPNLTSNGPNGTPQWYNLMRGLVSNTGQPFPSAVTGGTNFCYPGDPVTGQGPTFIGPARVSPPADVRMCLDSGPFSMLPGDTQQVVVAALAAQGSSFLSSVSYLKYYDDIAQTAYNYLFNLPTAPPSPKVNVAQLNGQIILSWNDLNLYPEFANTEETFTDKGYAFQGYNVWQIPVSSEEKAVSASPKRIATYDLNTSAGTIFDKAFDPITGFIVTEPVEYGTHSGLQHSITITQDAFTNSSIVNDRDYQFAVTAYSFNPQGYETPDQIEPNTLESPLPGHVVDVRAQTLAPGVTAAPGGVFSNVVHATGNSEAAVTVNVVNPDSITGDTYVLSWHNEMYRLDSTQVWTDVTAASKAKRLARPQDLTGSSISTTPSWSENKGALDLNIVPDVVSSNADFCDGVKLTFPAGVVLDTAYTAVSNNDGSTIFWYYVDQNGKIVNHHTNSIFYGDSTVYNNLGDSTLRTGDGTFAGGENLLVTVHPATLPMIVSYDMYDDNFGATYVDSAAGFPTGHLVDIASSDTVVGPIANKVVTQHQWSVTDQTTKAVVLSNQTIINGADLYDQRNFFKANNFYGPGGSSGTLTYNVGVAPVVFNGMSVAVSGSYNAPITIGADTIDGTNILRGTSPNSGASDFVTSNNSFDMTDFTVFGYSDATAATTLSAYVPGATGSTDLHTLEEDYQLKWTGVLADTVIQGDTVVYTKSGGSIATLFGAHNYSLANHPFNPNPGTAAPFTVRIPFEVWNTTKNEQVNLLVYDRSGNWPSQGFKVWETGNRTYVWVVDTKYSTNAIAPLSSAVADSATWNWVFYRSNFKIGDNIIVHYLRNIVIGTDTYTFAMPKVAYSSTLAKQGINEINVFPNPYFGFNKLESDKYDRWVRFTHLPTNVTVTIRIFNLAGILVRTLQQLPSASSSQFMDWNLLNEHQLPVASGMYIAFIDCGPLGTKTLKLAIIPEQQFLDHY